MPDEENESLGRQKGFCFMLLIVLSKLKCSVIHFFIETHGKWFNAHFLKKPMVWLNVEWNVQRVWPLLSSWSYLKGVKLEVHRRVGNEPGACYAFLLSLCLLPHRHSRPNCFSEVTEYFHSSCPLPGLSHHVSPCSHLSSRVLINQLSYNSKNPSSCCLPISNMYILPPWPISSYWQFSNNQLAKLPNI